MSLSPKQVNRLLNAIDCYQIDTTNNDNDGTDAINPSIQSLGYQFVDVLAFIDQHYDIALYLLPMARNTILLAQIKALPKFLALLSYTDLVKAIP